MAKVIVIENTDNARDGYGHWWGSQDVILSKDHLQALLGGKCLAFNDGEYAHFISMGCPEKVE